MRNKQPYYCLMPIGERVGRLITSFSYPQGSPMDHIMRRMKEANKNVSEVITDIITNHYELYDQTLHLRQYGDVQARLHNAHKAAAESAGLRLVERRDDFGAGKIIGHVYKDARGNQIHPVYTGGEEE